MSYDSARVRGLYASVTDGWTYLNGHHLPHIPEKVSSQVATAFRTSPLVASVEPARGSHSRAQAAGVPTGFAHDAAARRALADLVGARPDRVVLGPNKQILLSHFADAMAPRLGAGNSVVVARSVGADVAAIFRDRASDVRVAEPDLGTGELPTWQFHDIVSGDTRLVVVPAAHAAVGTITDVAGVRDIVRQHSRAWLLVDATDLAPYQPIDMDEWGADAVVVDCALLGGPQIAALIVRDTTMFPRLRSLTGAAGARQLEVGPLSMGLLGGVAPTVEHLADLDDAARGTRRNRLRTSMRSLAQYQGRLSEHLVESLGGLPAVHMVGITGEAAAHGAAERIPRVTFIVDGVDAGTVHERLLANGIVAHPADEGDPLLVAMGVPEAGGAVTVSLSPFTTAGDIDQLVRAVASLA